jgi:hypothetical protein
VQRTRVRVSGKRQQVGVGAATLLTLCCGGGLIVNALAGNGPATDAPDIPVTSPTRTVAPPADLPRAAASPSADLPTASPPSAVPSRRSVPPPRRSAAPTTRSTAPGRRRTTPAAPDAGAAGVGATEAGATESGAADAGAADAGAGGAASASRAAGRSGSPAAVFYVNCAEAREAGVAPLIAGEPGYRAALDRDGDGIACDT